MLSFQLCDETKPHTRPECLTNIRVCSPLAKRGEEYRSTETNGVEMWRKWCIHVHKPPWHLSRLAACTSEVSSINHRHTTSQEKWSDRAHHLRVGVNTIDSFYNVYFVYTSRSLLHVTVVLGKRVVQKNIFDACSTKNHPSFTLDALTYKFQWT